MSWRSKIALPNAPAAAPAQGEWECLPADCRVLVRGLSGAPEHNGSEGVVRGYDVAKQRHIVELPEKTLALRAANLLQLIEVRLRCGDSWRDCEISGLDEATGELTLREVELLTKEAAGGALPARARLGSGDGNVVLRPGAR